MKKLLVHILFAIICGSLPTFAQDNFTRQERQLVNEGNELFRAEKYHEALSKYDEALQSNPSLQYALYSKALTLLNLASEDNKNIENDPRKIAAQILSEIADMSSNKDLAAKSYYNLGNLAFNDEDYDRAIKMYKNSLKIEPDNKVCRQNLLMAIQKKKEQQEQNQDQQNQDQQNQDQQNQDQQNQQNQDQQNQDQQDQQNQDQQNQDQQDQDRQNQDKQNQQNQDRDQQQQGEDPHPQGMDGNQPQQPQMSDKSEQILQIMQNKENETRKNAKEVVPGGRRHTDKPW